MKIDDSFKKPGSVPFKWEIRPGVPKIQDPQPPISGRHHTEFETRKQHQKKQPKLKPPPSGLYFRAPLETRPESLQSSPRSSSHRFARPEVVSSAGCFPSPLANRKNAKKRNGDPRSGSEPEYYSDLDTPSRWSVSSRKSASPLSSSFASSRSSPRPVSDVDWAGFGLF
ncbi:hypothetical protein DH2020_034738 [Rehmannia glutinosa]|uniref:Uncharacterized protein n=1 Tax=Rehmannia glutinosa TaxID=99300 RepID=A0ABR0VBL5_REHGL